MDLEKRRKALMELVGELGEESFSKKLVEAYMKDTWFLRKDIHFREIHTPIRILEDIGRRSVYTEHFEVDPECLQPLGKVAVLLPKNSINLSISKAVASSFLAGNQTLVKFPGKLTHSYYVFKQWIEKHLPGVHFVPHGTTSEKFLRDAIMAPDID